MKMCISTIVLTTHCQQICGALNGNEYNEFSLPTLFLSCLFLHTQVLIIQSRPAAHAVCICDFVLVQVCVCVRTSVRKLRAVAILGEQPTQNAPTPV